MIRELDYERSTSVPTTPLVPIVERRTEPPPSVSGLVLLIGSLLALALALAHIGSATEVQAVAWAFVVAAVIAGLRKWA